MVLGPVLTIALKNSRTFCIIRKFLKGILVVGMVACIVSFDTRCQNGPWILPDAVKLFTMKAFPGKTEPGQFHLP